MILLMISNKTIREFERIALSDFGINPDVIDANRIADESEDYYELQREGL
ncbi:MAG: hypothetical protein NTX93_11200 [Bacteroidia bacterium]|nr:hypothetical protein [Bacteroidia bacterium]